MQCAKCGKENRDAANFCGQCGAPMQKTRAKTLRTAAYVLAAAFLLVLLAVLFIEAAGAQGALPYGGKSGQQVTVMVYISGGGALESADGSASADISQMLAADLPDNIHLILQTGGAQKWQHHGISAERSQRYEVKNHKLILLDDTLTQLSTTDGETLSDFIKWGADAYPAQRNILILWGHGAGSVGGFGKDDFESSDRKSLTISGLKSALDAAGVKFDFVGFDACLMSTLETALAIKGSADYMLASEYFESGYGWEHRAWLEALGENAAITTPELAEIIADGFIKESKKDKRPGVLALTDLSEADALYKAWRAFAMDTPYESLVPKFVQREISGYVYPENGETMTDYGMADLLEAAKKSDTKEAAALIKAAEKAIVVRDANSAAENLCGLSVSLPYLSENYYALLREAYAGIGLDDEYIGWLYGFVPQAAHDAA